MAMALAPATGFHRAKGPSVPATPAVLAALTLISFAIMEEQLSDSQLFPGQVVYQDILSLPVSIQI